jgi:hypothetical protein
LLLRYYSYDKLEVSAHYVANKIRFDIIDYNSDTSIIQKPILKLDQEKPKKNVIVPSFDDFKNMMYGNIYHYCKYSLK